MTPWHATAVAIVAITALFPACARDDGAPTPVPAQAESSGTLPLPADSLRVGPYAVVYEFEGFADPRAGTLRLEPLRRAPELAAPGLRTAEQAVGWCATSAANLAFVVEDASTDASECAALSESLLPGTDTSAYDTLGVFCQTVTLVNLTSRTLSAPYVEIIEHTGGSDQYAYVPSLGGTGAAPPENGGANPPSADRGGLFRYDDIGARDTIPDAGRDQDTTVWTFRRGSDAPFRFRARVLSEFRETCGNDRDDDCDGIPDNNCNEFALDTACADHNDCQSNFCRDQGSPDGVCREPWLVHYPFAGDDPETGDRLGAAAASNGDWAAVGAPGAAGGGEVEIYERQPDGFWLFHSRLRGGETGLNQAFGAALAMHGNTLVVADPDYETNIGELVRGLSYIYRYSAGSDAWVRTSTFLPPGAEEDDNVGASIDVWGEYLALGVPGDSSVQVGRLNPTGAPRGEGTRVVGSGVSASDGFGSSVAIDGAWMVVGAPAYDDGGAAFVFARSGLNDWSQDDLLIPVGTALGDGLGTAVAIEGGYLAIGAPGYDFVVDAENQEDDAGTVYLFAWDGEAWIEDGQLLAETPRVGDAFGSSLAFRGDRLIVGARDTNAGALSDAGAAYVYRRDADGWHIEGSLRAAEASAGASFGDSVALVNGGALVGATGLAGNTGGFYVFELGRPWLGTQELRFAEPAAVDRFGADIDIDGDVLLVGMPGDDGPGNAGSGVVMRRDPETGTWAQEAVLRRTAPLTNDAFGTRVAVWGTHAIIASPTARAASRASGAAAAFEYTEGTGWAPLGDLLPPADTLVAGDAYGGAVAVGGSWAAVGASRAAGGGTQRGEVHLFRFSGGVWAHRQRLGAPNPRNGDRFGQSVAISGDGNTLIVGAGTADRNGLRDPGAAYVFRRSGETFVHEATLGPIVGQHASDQFGFSVAIDGDTAAVGAPLEDEPESASGAVYLFVREADGSWRQDGSRLRAPDGRQGDRFGSSVDVSGDLVIVGAGGTDLTRDDQGAAYVFRRGPSAWALDRALFLGDGEAGDFAGGFGTEGGAVGISGSQAVVSAPNATAPVADSGRVVVFDR